MRKVVVLFTGLVFLGLPTPGIAQDRPQLDRARLRTDRQLPVRKPGLEGFPEDTIPAAVADTTPPIDIEARRDEIETEGFPRRDDVFRQLKELPGFMVFEYRGKEVRLDVEQQRMGLHGEAQVNRGRDVLVADTIRYRGDVKFMAALGNIQLVGEDQKDVRSDSVLYYDLATLKGTVYRAETQFMQGATTWRVMGDVIPKAQDTVYASQGAFTSCDAEQPHYRFQAGEIKLVNRDVIVAWPVVLYVGDVPVFWLPFFAQDIRPERRSGILPPRFGFNDVVQTSGSTDRNVTDFGYYWAINDYADLEASVDWFSGNYTRLNGTFRYRFLKKFFRGSIAYGQTFSSTGRNLTLGWNHNHELGLNTTFRVSGRYVQNTRKFQDQTYDPRLQTQSIDSDAGLNHRFSFANVAVSARRRQFLNSDQVDLTLPQLSLSFSPVTLFRAPRGQEGLFSNMTLSGTGNLSRRSTSAPLTTDTEKTRGALSGGLRVKKLNISGGFAYDQLNRTEEDSTGTDLPTTSVRRIDWNAGLDYQVDLIGSTTLRPNVRWRGGYFRSPNTGGDFVTVPTQFSFGATLSTDVFGFYPGFAGFSRVRHKLSPGFSWSYAPAVSVDSATAAIPDFPFDSIRGRNTLTFTLRQTFEAKVKSSSQAGAAIGTGERLPPAADVVAAPPGEAVPADSAAVASLARDSLAERRDAAAIAGPREALAPSAASLDLTGRGPPTQPPRDRVVTLLAINTSALVFDFERARQGEPALTSTTVSHSITSDLLRGLSINMTHRLFDGTGADRKFDLALQQIAVSFSLRSGQGIRDLIGLGSGSDRRTARERATGTGLPTEQEPDARSGLREFYDTEQYDPFDENEEGAGPWDLRLRYSLVRPTSGLESQTIDGTLTFQPTPKWAVRWTTQYNFTTSEFGQQFITLDRDLHRWRASFRFSRAPNGNVIFSVGVHLTDAPDIKGDYRQRTN